MSSIMKEPMEPAPSWEEINLGVRVLFANRFNLELNITQRMTYEEFERLFYHLFILIDPQEAKRKFSKLVYPAMDQQDRNKFIDSAVRFINDKQLTSGQRVATSQLRMYGGEAFRRLIGSLMNTVAEREISNMLGRNQLTEEQIESGSNLESVINHIEVLEEEISSQERSLKECCDKLANSRAKKAEIEQQSEECWYNLTRSLTGYSNPRSQDQALDMVTRLLSRLETSSGENKAAVEKLKTLKLPASYGKKAEGKSQAESNEKRLSQFIREAKAQLNSNQIAKDANRTNLGKEMKEQLVHLDNYMERMLDKLRKEAEKADQILLRNPQILERFRDLEKAIPLISLPPLVAQPGTRGLPPSVVELTKILSEFAEHGRDDREVLEIYERFVINTQTLKG